MVNLFLKELQYFHTHQRNPVLQIGVWGELGVAVSMAGDGQAAPCFEEMLWHLC